MKDAPEIKPMVMAPPNPEVERLFDLMWWYAAGCPKETAPKN